MKIALIIPANRWFCPYLNIYTKILDNNNIQYDVILWDREKNEAEHEHEFHFISRFQKNKIEKFISYFLYAKFIKKQVRKENYSKLIIFTPQVGIFISNFLKKYYKNSYIFDYRDLSIEQNRFFTRYFKRVLTNSFANIISSPGFKKYLPEEFYYLI